MAGIAKAHGIHAVTINSTNTDAWDAVYDALASSLERKLDIKPQTLAEVPLAIYLVCCAAL